jgi:DNA-binding HxlR family transcriptional regulator
VDQGSNSAEAPVPTLADLLRLLGSGPNSSILVALGQGPLRTRRLTERIPSYAPRTIYRHTEELERFRVVERKVRPGVPSHVTHNLTQPAGRELLRLFEAARPPGERAGAPQSAPLGLLAELWDTGLLEQLSCGPRSATELAHELRDLSLHQVARRARRLVAAGLLDESSSAKLGKRYSLSRRARRGTVLIAGLGRWRGRHVEPDGAGLTAAEIARLLRVSLPLVELAPGATGGLVLGVDAGEGEEQNGTPIDALLARADGAGRLRCWRAGPETPADARVHGTVRTWLSVLLDDKRGRLRVGGDQGLADACLGQLHSCLRDTPVAATYPG